VAGPDLRSGEGGTGAVGLHFLQTIIDISWGGKAVIFGPDDKNAPIQDNKPHTQNMDTLST
jgi:hypothetical protein